MSPRLRPWLWAAAGAVTALALGAAAGLTVILGGLFDTRADTPHLAVISWATHTAMMNSVRARAEPSPASRFTPAQVSAGFRIYDQRCAACHGGPGLPRAPLAAAMTPTPPYLLDSARRWSPGQLRFIVEHGVKMTAMPAWGEILSPDEVWSVVAFLQAFPTLTAADYIRLRAAQRPTPEPPVAAGASPA